VAHRRLNVPVSVLIGCPNSVFRERCGHLRANFFGLFFLNDSRLVCPLCAWLEVRIARLWLDGLFAATEHQMLDGAVEVFICYFCGRFMHRWKIWQSLVRKGWQEGTPVVTKLWLL